MRTVALILRGSFLLLTPFCAASTHAQGIPTTVNELSLSISPQYPRPYDTVTVTVGSTQLDLASGIISITVNGKVVSEGERSATFTLGGPGVKTTIQATVKDALGTHSVSRTITPADVALVLEPTSTVPPFYKGAKLVASEGSLRLIALPNFQTAGGTAIAPQSLSYTWKFGDKILEAQSGVGKNVLVATAPVRYRDARITVTVTNADKSLVAQATTLISPVDPVIRMYRNDPLAGVDFSSALSGSFVLPSDEETFRAVPYYYASSPTLAWTLNGTDSGSDADLTVRTTGATKGTALLGVRAAVVGLLNNTEARLTVQFGEARSTGIFGL